MRKSVATFGEPRGPGEARPRDSPTKRVMSHKITPRVETEAAFSPPLWFQVQVALILPATWNQEPGTSGSFSTPPQMARYSRRRRYRRPYSVSFRFGRSKRSYRRQATGAMQQRDIGRFVLKANDTGVISTNAAGTTYAVMAARIRDLIRQTPLFSRLKNIFDQYKINAIGVKIVPTGAQTPTAGTYLQTVIAWDRNGLDAAGLTYDQIATYGSTKINYYGPSGKTTMSHFIAAETIGEKTCYIPTVADNPPYAWNPTFLMGIKGPNALTAGQTYALHFAIEWSFDITFRGTRLG